MKKSKIPIPININFLYNKLFTYNSICLCLCLCPSFLTWLFTLLTYFLNKLNCVLSTIYNQIKSPKNVFNSFKKKKRKNETNIFNKKKRKTTTKKKNEKILQLGEYEPYWFVFVGLFMDLMTSEPSTLRMSSASFC